MEDVEGNSSNPTAYWKSVSEMSDGGPVTRGLYRPKQHGSTGECTAELKFCMEKRERKRRAKMQRRN
jgi:hypothetical protein